MYKVTKYPHGTFNWADCATQDATKAIPFYTAVMGWEAEDASVDETRPYTVFRLEGEYVAGLWEMDAEMKAMQIPSHWQNLIAVDNVDALVPKVVELGGKVLAPPFDIAQNGRMAFIQDNQGASFGLWQAKNYIGASVVNRPGAMCWNELACPDPAAAQAFYMGLFGWTFEKMPDMEYYLFNNNGRSNGGVIKMDAAWGEIPPHWMVYFNVEDIQASIERVQAKGGSLVDRGIIEAAAGKIAVIVDPTGGHVALIEASQIDPWVE